MKIIDILNKINNDEEVPKKVKFDGDIFTYNTGRKEYERTVGKCFKETLLFRVMNTHFIKDLLRTEVEVIEENKEIEELKKALNKLNETFDKAYNKLIKESEEK